MPEPSPIRLLDRLQVADAHHRAGHGVSTNGNGNGRKAYPGSGVQFVGNPDWRAIARLDTSSPDPDAEWLSRNLAFATAAYCYTAMRWRATRVAEAPLMIMRENEDGEEWLPDHPLAELFEEPRPDLEMGELLQRTQYYRDLTGAALWVFDRPIGDGSLPRGETNPASITPFSADEFRSFAVGNLIYGRYEIRLNGQWVPRAREDVVHFRDVNPLHWRDCLSLVDVALMQLNLGHTVNRIVDGFLRRAMFPGGIVSPDPQWHPSEQEWTDWKELVEQWHATPARAGKNLFAPGGTTFSRIASGLQDLLPAPILDRVEATIGSVFGTPPVILGWLSGMQNSPWSQMAEARTQGYEDTIEPIWRDVERRLTKALVPMAERKAGVLVRFDTSKVRALQDDEERNSRISANNHDTWTVGERRLFTGQDLLGDERDDIITGLPQPGAPDALGADGQPTDPAAADQGKASGDTKDLLWWIFDRDSKAAEPGWERAIYLHLQRDRDRIMAAARRTLVPTDPAAKARGITPGSQDAFGDEMDDLMRQSHTELLAIVHPLLLRTGGKAVTRLAARLRLSFQVLEPGLAKYAQREAAFLAKVMGETTGAAVAKAVQAGLNEGETIADLVKRLEDLPAFDRTRAKLVARTETTRAWNGAQRTSLSDYSDRTGREALKTWLSARDDRVREEHQELDGEDRKIDEAFSNGLQEPGEPNCRCTLIYRMAEEA